MNGSTIFSEEYEGKELGEIVSSKFKSLAKEYFQIEISTGIDYTKILKESSRFYSFNLPYEINEMFIRYESAPLFWIYRSPLIIQLEEFYKISISNLSGQNYYKTIREFYSKWLLINSEEEKRYFSSSAINYIEKRSNNNNFLHLIFQALILAYDDYFFDPLKSFELLERAKENVSQTDLGDEIKDELKYLLNIYEGFIFLKQSEYTLAQNYFNAALAVKISGITAKFYSAYSSVLLKNDYFPEDVLSFVFNYDISMIEYAIEKNDFNMLEYFINYPVFNNLLLSKDISQSYDLLSNFLRDAKASSQYDLNRIKINLNNFKNLNLHDHYNDNVISNIAYLEKIFLNYLKNENVLFKGAAEKLHQKFIETLEIITNTIKEKYNAGVMAKLQVYDNEIQNKLNEIQMLSKEREENRVKIKDKINKTLKVIEKRTAENISMIEEKVNNLQLVPNFDPKASFQNAMTYNFILSFTVFLMGGCAGYSNSSLTDLGTLNTIMATIITSGLKWGIIAFSVGLIISIISAALAVLEGNSQKQKLLQAINDLKKERDYQIDYYKKEAEHNEKIGEERYNKNIEDKKKYIDKLKGERDVQEKKHREEADQKINEECNPILKLMEF
ncbi:MAG: hypothetical protein ACYCVH_10855 [Ignavibacteriaceae bacterium]